VTKISAHTPMNLGTDGNLHAQDDSVRTALRVRKHHFFGFSVRQMLLLLSLSAVLLGIWTPRIRHRLLSWELQQDFDRRSAAVTAAVADLNRAIKTDDVKLARRALEAGARPNLDPRENLICTCIDCGRVEIFKLLLQFDADHLIRRNPPLDVAAGCNQPPEIRCELIRLLVDAGADPRESSFDLMEAALRWSDGRTGDLLRAYGLPYGPREMVTFNRVNEVKCAVKEAPGILKDRFRGPWSSSGEDATLLAIAVYRGYLEMSEVLIESGAQLDSVAYPGFTLLHLAALNGDAEIIRLLVAHGLDVNAVNAYSHTPLNTQLWRANPQAVAALLEAGADVNHRGSHGRTPLHEAAWDDAVKIVELLLAAGGDPTLADEKGDTPLDLARTRKPQNPAIVTLLEQAQSRWKSTNEAPSNRMN
jgi:ankyrin repeat protein